MKNELEEDDLRYIIEFILVFCNLKSRDQKHFYNEKIFWLNVCM